MLELEINVNPDSGCVTLVHKVKLPLSWTTKQIIELMEANGLMLNGITVEELSKMMKKAKPKRKKP